MLPTSIVIHSCLVWYLFHQCKKSHSDPLWSGLIRELVQELIDVSYVLIPKFKPMPRSTSTPRSKSKPRYPLYSSLVSCHNQMPISVTAKHPCPVMIPLIFCPWPKCHSPPIHYVLFPQVVMRWQHSTLWPHTPWQLEVTHSRRLITHHQSPFIPYPFSISCSWPSPLPFSWP